MSRFIQVIVEDRDGQCHQQELSVGQSLMQQLCQADFDIEAVCGGCCSCATCHVLIDHQGVGPAESLEQALLSGTTDYHPAFSRLSCQITVDWDLHNQRIIIAQED